MNSEDSLYKDFQEKPSQEMLVDKLTKEIEANFNNDQLGVDNLAKAVGMSRSNLHRKLHKIAGISTSQFIREYRLKRALEILKEEDITASETAYRVGFSSATYFNTCFNKFYGFTPGEIKSRNSEEIEKLVRAESLTIGKNKTNKRVLWAVLFAVSLLTAIFYFYTSDKKGNGASNTSESIIDAKSIAVLPFKNLTGKPDLDYVSDGMTDAVISRLTKISAIGKVIPFTSTLSYKKTEKTIEEIAAELGVSTLLQGNLQISGNRIKINLQLINATTSEHLWSKEYARDWKTDEIFKMQTEVVEGIAANMNAIIAQDELADIQKIPTKNKQAYTYYLQGEFQRQKGNELSYSNAISLYEKAIAADSNFVEPYIDMANIWHMGGSVWGFYDEQMAWGNAKILLEQALQIEPANQRVEEELNTGSFFYDWNFELVEKFYQNILSNSVHDKPSVISLDYPIKTGRPKETLKAIERFIINDPSNVFSPFFKAEAMFYLGSTDEAIEILTQTDPLYNDNWFYLRESTKLYFYLGEYEKSKIQLEKITTQFPDYPPILMWLNAIYTQMDGNSKVRIQYFAELQNEYDKGSSGSPAWFIALYYAHIKDYEKTFEWLQKSYERHEVEMTWLREEPLLAPVRNDSRYKDLYEKVGFSSIGLPIKASSKN
ncbi:TolB amino-terminal domain-containing protein [Maribacter dokdonensis]|uniref:TolB amino-terminal domain-containing protein n=1 Tax=Maribacter dokdonensis TaxID=320912 RepID=A0A1H4J067_9FLAO|nr:helix-turn-helix domain-containing protein [Maribacter dokdonensis]SEB39316.1 TolB amino-terminal domain-containing protein [Maribacter dokdonensis]